MDMEVDSGGKPATSGAPAGPAPGNVHHHKQKTRPPWALSPASLAASQIAAVPFKIMEALRLAVEARDVPPNLVEQVASAMLEPLKNDNPGYLKLLNDGKLLDKEVAGIAAPKGWKIPSNYMSNQKRRATSRQTMEAESPY